MKSRRIRFVEKEIQIRHMKQLTIRIGHPTVLNPLHKGFENSRPIFGSERGTVHGYVQSVAHLLGIGRFLLGLDAKCRLFACFVVSSAVLVRGVPVAHLHVCNVDVGKRREESEA